MSTPNRRVAVTGATSGIGEATARRLAKTGDRRRDPGGRRRDRVLRAPNAAVALADGAAA